MSNLFSKLFKKQSSEEDEQSLENDKILESLDNEELTDEEIERILEEAAAAAEAEEDYFEDEEEKELEPESEQDIEDENFFQKLKSGLFKTRNSITGRINAVVANFRVIDEEFFDELEEILITSDIGVETSLKILEDLREQVKLKNLKNTEDIIDVLKEELQKILGTEKHPIGVHSPEVILIIGVNGVGKTTSIGKIACRLKKSGKKVLIAAADTFRAGAIEQLEIWGKRADVDVISHQEGADPAAVIFDAINASKSRKTDVLICDTAGRLHNKKNLMDELKKINKVIDREYPEAFRETLLVLDATTGQNAVAQAKVFKEVAGITGIILTKLDGTAKGGIVIAIANELNISVRFVGVGEKIDDLQDFDPKDFVEALFDL